MCKNVLHHAVYIQYMYTHVYTHQYMHTFIHVHAQDQDTCVLIRRQKRSLAKIFERLSDIFADLEDVENWQTVKN